MKVFSFDLNPSAYEAITVSTAAIGFTAALIRERSVVGAFITLETGQIRFRMDGIDPSSTTGHLLEIGQSLTLKSKAAVEKIKFIKTGDTSGALKVTYLNE